MALDDLFRGRKSNGAKEGRARSNRSNIHVSKISLLRKDMAKEAPVTGKWRDRPSVETNGPQEAKMKGSTEINAGSAHVASNWREKTIPRKRSWIEAERNVDLKSVPDGDLIDKVFSTKVLMPSEARSVLGSPTISIMMSFEYSEAENRIEAKISVS